MITSLTKPSYLWAKIFKKLHGKAVLNCDIDYTSKIEAGSEVVNTRMQRHSFCGYYCKIMNCEIGSFCSIANNVVIGDGMHPMDWASTSPTFYRGRDSVLTKFSEHERKTPLRTIIGHDVWIGERVIIKQGVNIGTGSVIGMGSVVTRDVSPYTIVAGSPARPIRLRFDENIIRRLLESEWWNRDDDVLRRAAKQVKNPTDFLKELGL
jgi:acetyltransferase-like isoleucine patch superfamily enzyme